MASYGTIIGTCSNREANYTAKIFWRTISQDITANTSKIAIWSGIENDGSAYNWNGTCSNWYLKVNGAYLGNTNGAGGGHITTFTSDSASSWTWPNGLTAGSTVFNSNRTESLLNVNYPWHVEVTIPHNSDGTKTVPISHTYSLLSGGAGPGNVNISGNIVLNAIPRSSVINSFSIENHLIPSTANSVNYGITSYSSSFSHYVTLKIGAVSIQSWTIAAGVSSGTLTLTDTAVNTLLSNMPTATSATVTLVVQTKLGTTNIGTAASKTATASVSSTVVPQMPTVTLSEAASLPTGIDVYVQSKSKIKFTIGNVLPATNSGATIKSCVLNYLNVDIPLTVSGSTLYYTTDYLPSSGTYFFSVTVTDSRNRVKKYDAPSSHIVHSYGPPVITTFTGSRSSTTITLSRVASDSYTLDGKNSITTKLYRRTIGTSTWTDLGAGYQIIDTLAPLAVSALNVSITGHTTTVGYEFKFEVVDKFNTTVFKTLTFPSTTVEAVLALGTKSVGIGKYIDLNEPYTLDVAGTTRISGDTTIGGNLLVGGTAVSLTTHSHNIFTLIETKTISVDQVVTTTHGTFQYRDFLTFTNYIPSTNGTVMINLNVNGYYGSGASYGFTRAQLHVRNSLTANSSSGTIETYYRLFFPTGTDIYHPQLFSEGSVFMDVTAGTTYRFKVTSYGDNRNAGVAAGSKASLYFIPRI